MIDTKDLFRRRTVSDLQAEAEFDQRLHRALGPVNLVALGVGAIIGTGIFVLTGTVAAQNAGPAVVLSFVLAGIASVFAALCYSEFASLVPLSGSAYTYGYATLGELFAWIIGWDLVLEYAVGAITVAIGWSGYVVSLLHGWGINFPPQFAGAHGLHYIFIPLNIGASLNIPDGWQVTTPLLLEKLKAIGTDPATLPQATSIFNLPAVFIVFVVTTLLVIGIKESATFNNIIVAVKVGVVLLFIVFGAMAIDPQNWKPFIPPNEGTFGSFGMSGILMGAGVVFFAYIGFDAVSTAAQEAKNPRRDMPIGIIGSLIVCTILYILVSGVTTGIVSYKELNVPDPIARAADHAKMGWMASLIKLGAIAGLSSVILVMLYGQSRVFFAMARDGLLPPFIHQVHPRFKTPWITSIVVGIIVAIFAALFTVREAGELCSIGTLLAFVIVSVGVLVLRIRHPEYRANFRVPAVWLIAPLGALTALILMISLPHRTWIRLISWMLIGLIIYFTYSRKHSVLARRRDNNATVSEH